MTAARIYLGVLLVLMAIGQLVSFDTFTDIIQQYDVTGPRAPSPALLVLIEFLAAAGLLAPVPGKLRYVAAGLGVVAAVLWSLLAVQGLARGLDIDNCGCFGSFLGQPLTIWVIPQDAVFLALALYVARAARREVARSLGADVS